MTWRSLIFFSCFFIQRANSQCSATSVFASCTSGSYYNGNVFKILFNYNACYSVGPQWSSLSISGKSLDRSIFATYLVDSTYSGPCIKIRRSSDSLTSDFYFDAIGNAGTALRATGTSFVSWIGSSDAFVTVWYDQSSNANHATQTTTSYQPRFMYFNGYIDFFSPQYLNIPATTIPCSAGSNYGIYTRVGTINVGGKFAIYLFHYHD